MLLTFRVRIARVVDGLDGREVPDASHIGLEADVHRVTTIVLDGPLGIAVEPFEPWSGSQNHAAPLATLLEAWVPARGLWMTLLLEEVEVLELRAGPSVPGC